MKLLNHNKTAHIRNRLRPAYTHTCGTYPLNNRNMCTLLFPLFVRPTHFSLRVTQKDKRGSPTDSLAPRCPPPALGNLWMIWIQLSGARRRPPGRDWIELNQEYLVIPIPAAGIELDNALSSKHIPPAKLSKDLTKLLNLNKTAHVRSRLRPAQTKTHMHTEPTYSLTIETCATSFVCMLLFIPLGRDWFKFDQIKNLLYFYGHGRDWLGWIEGRSHLKLKLPTTIDHTTSQFCAYHRPVQPSKGLTKPS